MAGLRLIPGSGPEEVLDSHLCVELVVDIDYRQEDPTIVRYLYPNNAEGKRAYEARLAQDLRGSVAGLGEKPFDYKSLASFYESQKSLVGLNISVQSDACERQIHFEGNPLRDVTNGIKELDMAYSSRNQNTVEDKTA